MLQDPIAPYEQKGVATIMADIQNASPVPLLEQSTPEMSIDEVIASVDGTASFREELRQASVLLLPSNLGPEYDGAVFPEDTVDIFRFLNVHLPHDTSINIAVDDADYTSFAFKSEEIILPTIFVFKELLIPTVTTILADYIRHRLPRRNRKDRDATVECEIRYRSSGSEYSLKYRGPASTFEATLSEQARNVRSSVDDECDTAKDGDHAPK